MMRWGSRSFGCALLIASLLLAGCDALDTNTVTDQPAKTSFATQVPSDLRSLDTSELRVVVSVNNGFFDVFGSSVESDNWIVPISIEVGNTYDVTVSWYYSSHLVLEEYSTITADPSQLNIVFQPAYFITSGYIRFDDDCDGVSNYVEALSGANIGPVSESPDTDCSNVTLTPSNDMPLHLATNGWIFESVGLNSEPINRFEQSINIGRQNRDRNAHFHTELVSERRDDGTSEYLLQIRFINQVGGQKHIQFWATEAISWEESEQPLSSCSTEGEISGCQIRYEWQENHWYELLMSEVSPGFWQAFIIDKETDVRTLIGSIELETDIEWSRAISGLYYTQLQETATCQQAFPRIAAQYTDILINDSVSHEASFSFSGTCLRLGGGWSNGQRDRDTHIEYSLSIGAD